MERATGAIVEPEVLDARVDRLRMNIDAVDAAIIALLKERQQYSQGIRRFKKRAGKPAIDLTRERDVVGLYVAGLGKAVGYEVANAVLHYSKEDLDA